MVFNKKTNSDIDKDDKRKNKYCADDDEYRINCDICDDLVIDTYYKNHLKSRTHINNIHRTKQVNIVNNWISLLPIK